MNTKAERREELKERIEILEQELQARKKELQACKEELQACKEEMAILDRTDDVILDLINPIYEDRTDDVVLDLTNPIYEVSIDCLSFDFSCLAYNKLRRAGINTCRDLISLSDDDLKACIPEKDTYDEVWSKLIKFKQNNDLFPAYIQKKLELQKQDFEMLPRFLCALKTYSKIRQKAKENNIYFGYLGKYGNFAKWYRLEKSYRIKLERCAMGPFRINQRILGQVFIAECLIGQHPKMFEMLRAEEMTTELVKAAIIEDLTEAMPTMKKETRTYEEFLSFVKLIQEFYE